ncbi:hypothetical protein O6H91_Y049100 [Diphasiastrum complanatum]|nr:hypothetical protein O6H91_Y049100 [Diphasiastrum complanatum]
MHPPLFTDLWMRVFCSQKWHTCLTDFAKNWPVPMVEFFHILLSSQHIGLLCLKKPHNLTQVEEVIGKQKAELYGKEILTSIKKFLAQNPESSFSAGKWTSPKNNRSRSKSKGEPTFKWPQKLMSPKQSVGY